MGRVKRGGIREEKRASASTCQVLASACRASKLSNVARRCLEGAAVLGAWLLGRTTDRVTPFPRRRGLEPDVGLLTRRVVLGPPSQNGLRSSGVWALSATTVAGPSAPRRIAGEFPARKLLLYIRCVVRVVAETIAASGRGVKPADVGSKYLCEGPMVEDGNNEPDSERNLLCNSGRSASACVVGTGRCSRLHALHFRRRAKAHGQHKSRREIRGGFCVCKYLR